MTVALAYDERGAGEPPLVFVHGWCCDRTFFAPQAEHFARSHRVITLDLRGCGASPAPDNGYDIASLAADVAGLAEQLDLRGAVVAGHSLGGMIAIELAATRPDLLAGAVAVDPGPIDPTSEIRDRFAALAEALQGPEGPEARREYVLTRLFGDRDAGSARERIVEVMCNSPLGPAGTTIANLPAWDGVAALRAVRVPLLFVLARAGGVNDPDRVLVHNPAVEFGITVGTGHFNQLFAPEQVTSMIERFLELRVRPGRDLGGRVRSDA